MSYSAQISYDAGVLGAIDRRAGLTQKASRLLRLDEKYSTIRNCAEKELEVDASLQDKVKKNMAKSIVYAKNSSIVAGVAGTVCDAIAITAIEEYFSDQSKLERRLKTNIIIEGLGRCFGLEAEDLISAYITRNYKVIVKFFLECIIEPPAQQLYVVYVVHPPPPNLPLPEGVEQPESPSDLLSNKP